MEKIDEICTFFEIGYDELSDLMGVSYSEMSNIIEGNKLPSQKMQRSYFILEKIFLHQNDTN